MVNLCLSPPLLPLKVASVFNINPNTTNATGSCQALRLLCSGWAAATSSILTLSLLWWVTGSWRIRIILSETHLKVLVWMGVYVYVLRGIIISFPFQHYVIIQCSPLIPINPWGHFHMFCGLGLFSSSAVIWSLRVGVEEINPYKKI